MEEISAWVLAGGRSRRMGRDKALIEIGGQTLLRRVVDLAHSITPRVAVLGGGGDRDYGVGLRVVDDVFPAQGPLAGIHAALRATATELNLVLAVDAPFVTAEFLRYLVARASATSAVVTLPRVGTRLQPLCAVYRRAFADVAEPALREGNNKIDALFPRIRVEIIDEPELQSRGFSAGIFRNLNTPEDIEGLQGSSE